MSEARLQHSEVTSSPRWVRGVRLSYAVLGGLCVAGILLQVYFAGLGLLVSGVHLRLHVNFAHILHVPVMAMLVLGFLGRYTRPLIVLTVVQNVLFVLQYRLIESRVSVGLFAWRALHPVNGVLLFAVGVYLYILAYKALRSSRTTDEENSATGEEHSAISEGHSSTGEHMTAPL